VTSAPHLLPLIRDGERVTVPMPRLPAGSTAFAVVTSIRRALMLGNLRHGDQFSDEDGLAASFGISRRLVHRGLLILVDSGQATRQGSTGWQLAER
jgi:DNA-binding GntR family transcriptional regulator